MHEIKFDRIDPEDVNFMFDRIDKIFGVDLDGKKILDTKNFGDLTEYLYESMNGQQANDCVTQKTFYAVRNLLCEIMNCDKRVISPQTNLKKLLPKEKRQLLKKKLREYSGIDVEVIGAPDWLTVLAFFVACISVFFAFVTIIGFLVFSVSIGIWFIGERLGTTMKIATVSDIVLKIISRNYDTLRRDLVTKNKGEVTTILKFIVIDELCLADSKIEKDTKLMWDSLL